MNLDVTDALSASLAEPLNNAVKAANGAQFSLMLSLMFEAKVGKLVEAAEITVAENYAERLESESHPAQLSHSLSLALQSGHAAAFNLFNCLHQECPIKQDVSLLVDDEPEEFSAAFDRRGSGQEMINEIQNSQRQAASMAA